MNQSSFLGNITLKNLLFSYNAFCMTERNFALLKPGRGMNNCGVCESWDWKLASKTLIGESIILITNNAKKEQRKTEKNQYPVFGDNKRLKLCTGVSNILLISAVSLAHSKFSIIPFPYWWKSLDAAEQREQHKWRKPVMCESVCGGSMDIFSENAPRWSFTEYFSLSQSCLQINIGAFCSSHIGFKHFFKKEKKKILSIPIK